MSVEPKKVKDDSDKPAEATTQETLANLRQCQNDIITYRHKCDRQIDEIEKSYSHNVRPHLERRNVLIQNIPKFWSKAILNHPLISTVFEPGEADILHYLSNLEVEDDPVKPDFFKIHFSFRKNPYFDNRTLTKEFKEDGSINTPIRWKKGQLFPRVTKHELWEDDDLGLEYKGFFRWYLDNNEHYCDPIADIIKTSIWYNPMEFYDGKIISRELTANLRPGSEPRKSEPVPGDQPAVAAAEPKKISRDKEKTLKKVKKPYSRSEN